MGRKIPGRKHRGVRDPEKQAAVRFESLKNKINAPPTNPDHQEVSKTLQRIIDLKNKVKSGELFKRNKQPKPEDKNNENKEQPKFKGKNNGNIKKGKKPFERKPEKPARKFVQLPGETDRAFVHRMNRICTETVKEAEFEDKYGVDIKRNEDGEVEEVVKRQKDELELLLKKAKKKKIKEEKDGKKKKKKKKDKPEAPRLSKWQKRKKKLDEKQQRKENVNVDEFKEYKDHVKFGEIAHAPPSLIAPRRAEKLQSAPRPGNKNLLLKSVINKKPEVGSVDLKKNKDGINKTSKVIDKKGKRKELPNSLRRQLDKQQKEIIEAYKKIKLQKYSK
ncbi:coiled-coil domain-containing protein 137 [Diabrotica virgifera virgifera]|uniref:Coiled-coil domain-containing protein 137 n=1 Tax=Diabrotica virgifera virgifera TaxID=50390 RepID=A0A6P7GEH5_DIAVI|nr:coiled-coil domain-containing protein 137 [Diabrotica virgifera virgifera]